MAGWAFGLGGSALGLVTGKPKPDPMQLPTPPGQMGATYVEPMEGDSMTKWIRSQVAALQGQGAGISNYGQGLVGQATDTMSPAASYWSKILSGDKAAMTEAVAPSVRMLQTSYDAARKNVNQNMARGGYQSAAAAELPFQRAGAISDLLSKLQPEAATQITNLAKILGDLGLSETSLGQNLLNMALNAQLTRRGQNVQEHGQAMQMASQQAAAFQQGLSNLKPGSDRKLKCNLRSLAGVLERVERIPVYIYDFIHGNKNDIGVIAQEVREEFPELVRPHPEHDYLTVDYMALAAVAIAAVQELAQKVEQQRVQIEQLERTFSKEVASWED